MLTALCISGNNTVNLELFQYTVLENYSNLKIFYSNKSNFINDLISLANQKQLYELNYKDHFSKVIYINSNFEISKIKSIKSVSPNTLYSVATYTDAESEVFFHNKTQYYIDPGFFYCDSKTFNLVSLYSKFKNMILGEHPIPEKSEFYIFLLNMGIKIDDI